MKIMKYLMVLISSVMIAPVASAMGMNPFLAAISMSNTNLGVTFYEELKEEAFEQISKGGERFNFFDDIYLVVIDTDDNNKWVAHSSAPELIGTIPEGPDFSEIARIILEAVNDEGAWVSYMLTQPSSKIRGQKHSYVKRRDNYVFISGYWE